MPDQAGGSPLLNPTNNKLKFVGNFKVQACARFTATV
jgi:hypothetical protein